MRAALVLVLPVAACFTKPDPVAGTPPADAVADALADSALDSSRACAFDSFDMGLGACQPWGTGYGNANFSTANGEVTIAPRSAFGGNDGGCLGNSMVPFADGGIAMDVVEVPGSPSGYLKLIAFDDASNPMIMVQGGMIRLTNEPRDDFAVKGYLPGPMRWWRLRPDRMNGVYVGDTSPDGVTWTKLGQTVVVPLAATITVKFEAGVTANEPSAGQARIAELQVCPP